MCLKLSFLQTGICIKIPLKGTNQKHRDKAIIFNEFNSNTEDKSPDHFPLSVILENE